MKISYNWLREYLNFDAEPDELSAILTSIGLEVEGVEEWESVKGGMKGVVIGRVITCERHPDADRLSVTTVDTGDPNLFISSAVHLMLLRDRSLPWQCPAQ